MVFCSKCGNELSEGADFCSKCGMAVNSNFAKSKRRTSGYAKRKINSNLTIVLIIIIVTAIAVGLLSALFFLGAWKPFGEVVGSGNLVTNEEFISDFTSVDATSGFKVGISQSNSHSVLVEADDNVMEYIEVRKSGDTLVIGVKLGYDFRSVTLNVEIAMPQLYNLELSGGTQAILEEFSVIDLFSVELSGGSHLAGEFLTTGDAEFDLSGGSHLSNLVGGAKDLSIDASSGSNLDLLNFPVQNANVELSGGSHATINLDGRLDADLSGGSILNYYGDPTLGTIDQSEGSLINKK